MTSLTREQVERTLNLIVDHSLRCWKSSDEVQMILDHDAALRAQLAQVTQQLADVSNRLEGANNRFERDQTRLAERDVSIGNLQDEILKLDHHILERDGTIATLKKEVGRDVLIHNRQALLIEQLEARLTVLEAALKGKEGG